jgi:hypothetical protein
MAAIPVTMPSTLTNGEASLSRSQRNSAGNDVLFPADVTFNAFAGQRINDLDSCYAVWTFGDDVGHH